MQNFQGMSFFGEELQNFALILKRMYDRQNARTLWIRWNGD